jgi:hypothetical protein
MFISPLAQTFQCTASPCAELILERLELERLLKAEISAPKAALDGETRDQILRSLVYRLRHLGYVRRLKKVS